LVKLRLKRIGKKGAPIYKIVAADSRSPRDGRFIESVGHYNPHTDPLSVKFNETRVLYWLKTGAQPTVTVRNLMKSEGILMKLSLSKAKISEEKMNEKIQKFVDDKPLKIERQKAKKIRQKVNKAKKAEEKTAEAKSE